MDKRKKNALRAKLVARREELMQDIEKLDAKIVELGIEQEQEGGSTGNHLADDGSSLGEQQVMSTLENDVQELIDEIDAALRRFDDGTFGICQRCANPINEERLTAFPYVAFCIECQSFLEKQAGLFGTQPAARTASWS